MPDDSTTTLVLDAQRGVPRAQDRLVAQHLPLVYNIVGRALGGSHADVDDIVQDTFIRALTHLAQLREPERFRAWLVVIATNRIRDHWRAVQAASTGREPMDEDTEPTDPGSDFADLTILRLNLTGQRAEVAEATRWMDEDDRTLLSLWWLEAAGRLSRAEVADSMGLSAQHTAVRVQRMKERLETARAVVRALAHRPRCAVLDELTGRWDGVPSALWRKRLARHIGTCANCDARRRGLVPAEGLLMGLALVPVATGLLRLVEHDLRDLVLAAAHTRTDDAPSPATEPSTAAPAAGDQATVVRAADAAREDGATPRPRAPLAAAAVLLLIGAGAAGLHAWGPGPAPEPGSGVRLAPVRSTLPVAPEQIGEPASGTTHPEPSTTSGATRRSASVAASPSRTAARPTPLFGPSAQRMFDLVNQERVRAGCTPLRPDRRLTTAAQKHSEDMVTRGYFSHTNPDGLDSGDRIAASGYDADGHNENISSYDAPEGATEAWMSGGGHREAIVDCDHEDVGIGYATEADGGALWTLLLARS
ncbi:sigma-70 family RNA polymerase sigma factor [Streptomyces sp. NPDC048606]|uniref:sigma-70 family RNA polymerase sigma factor n=1 Tax=Streptomyces sp. NPDC048606 TaxID=3154726 RepID=UPI003412375E